MEQYQMDSVRDVIEALVAELGPDNVPVGCDVDGAIASLTPQEESADADQEEGAEASMEEAEFVEVE